MRLAHISVTNHIGGSIIMVDYREMLRINSLKYTQRQIATSVHSSRNTISEVIKLAEKINLSWPLDDRLTNEKVYALLYPNKLEAVNPRKEPDYNYIHKELAKPGANLTLLWTGYCSECYASKLIPYMYTQFCDKYRKWARLTKVTMRISHKPGDTMQVDRAGTTIPYYDRVTGDAAYDAYLFAAVLPCSCYAYVEACHCNQLELASLQKRVMQLERLLVEHGIPIPNESEE